MGNKLLYNLIVKPLSWLPFWMLYVISDVAKFFIYTVFGYRKKVVLTNMRNS
ncbi:MAG TPA: acetyltransferase, partial [Flavobacteriales bacterium]|nr:acetyltransferase [Flavobacteriales bacterium]